MKLLTTLFALLTVAAHAQNAVPFTSPRWKIKGSEAITENFQNKLCLKLTDGSAVLSDANFTNGIIEFDMAVTRERYFPGLSFRALDSANGEEFYLRPHQSGNPDAMQYYPEYYGDGAWQLYYGDGFGKPHAIPFDRWFHVKLLVKDTMAEVYLDDEQQPALFIKKLYRPVAAGMITLENPWPVAARYANFSYRATNDVVLQSKPKPLEALPANVFTAWQISKPFDEKLLQGKYLFNNLHIDSLKWQTFTTDGRGVADLGKLAPVLPGKNTVFARLVIHSDKAVTKRLRFGFSDRVYLYYGGKLLYSGSDVFLSRDYRFLGTMGLYDAVYIDLQKGDNEVWMAIAEDYGGWGVMAMLEDL